MKKIGILFGMEETFPPAFVERVNSKKEKDIVAEYECAGLVVYKFFSDDKRLCKPLRLGLCRIGYLNAPLAAVLQELLE